MRYLLAIGWLLVWTTGPLNAQDSVFPVFRPELPVASLDRERLFRESAFGQVLLDEIEARSQALSEENRRIEGELQEEERTLTELRKSEEPDAFRSLANEFDQKVKQIRTEQAEKLEQIRRDLQEGEVSFQNIAEPVLLDLMAERGILFILDRTAIILEQGNGDITDLAIEAIDAASGNP